MSESDKEEGIALTLLNRLTEVRLPRALAIKEQVDRGEVLDESEIAFLERVFEEAIANKSQWEKHPELTEIISKVAALYNEITAKALENEKNSKSS
jgi:hypothetical protein